MRIYLIRHGKTEGNALNRYIGSTDSPLCAEGIEKTRLAGGSPELKSVIVTPLIRTQQTARILFPNAEQRICYGLREIDFGDFENRSATDMEHDEAYRKWVDSGCVDACPNGEGIDGFSDRVVAAFAQEVERAWADNEKRLVVVTHGGVIMALMSRLGRPKLGFYDWYLPNCACVAADVKRGDKNEPVYLDGIEIKERVEL